MPTEVIATAAGSGLYPAYALMLAGAIATAVRPGEGTQTRTPARLAMGTHTRAYFGGEPVSGLPVGDKGNGKIIGI